MADAIRNQIRCHIFLFKVILRPVDQSEPEPQLGPEIGLLADGFPQFLPDFDQTWQGRSVGYRKCPGEF